MVTWAQRNNLVFLTICLEDCNSPDIKVEKDSLYFKGIGGPDKKTHEVTMKFFKEVDPEVSFNCFLTLGQLFIHNLGWQNA